MNGSLVRHNFSPKYLGVTLDRSITFKQHLSNTARKLQSRNNIVLKLSGTSWAASAEVLRTSALSLVFSTAEYCAAAWLGSAHTSKVDVELNKAMRVISGTLQSTLCHWLPVLSRIAPPDLRRKDALLREVCKIQNNPNLPCYAEFLKPTKQRLKSRNPSCSIAKNLVDTNFNIKHEWTKSWGMLMAGKLGYGITPGSRIMGSDLPRRDWCKLNRLRTGHGRCAYYKHRCGWVDSPACGCGAEAQTIQHIIQDCPITRYVAGPPEDLITLSDEAIKWLNGLSVDI
ncbi:uncharacterized protein LOC134799704 [Cydia splendana]|uniref:uncharacterized protein LOC134799704 n=1 Tax=Cydia splendana TaxID=1100963 RepID=UPI00300C5910